MKYFSILGERCSGTIFTEYAIKENFEIYYKRLKEKHFFGFNDEFLNDPDTLYIFVIRNPVDWIDSFFKRTHHVPPENKQNIYNFIRNEFYSIYEEGALINTEIMEDRNMNTNERYRDIFELRKVKNDYIINDFSKKVENLMVIRYEDLRDDYENTLDRIKERFQLKKCCTDYKKIQRYKGTYSALYSKKPILLPENIIDEIKKKIDIEQEASLGYLLE